MRAALAPFARILAVRAPALVRTLSLVAPPPASPAPPSIPGVLAAGDEEGVLVALFTCKVCETRAARRVSKRAMRSGTVLIRCPGCLGLHVLADRLGFFDDATVDAEALLAARGETVRRADADGVVELTDDDRRVLASAGAAVRLRAARTPAEAAGGTGAEGEHLGVASFEGVLAARKPSA